MNKVFEFDKEFILANIVNLIELDDYVPFDFRIYGFEKERDEFLESKNLLKTIREMDKLLNEKCKHYKHPILAHNSVIHEWLELHPEFEGIISAESFPHYNSLKENHDYIDLIEICYESTYGKKEWKPPKNKFCKDDSSIQLPNFNKIDEIFDEYGATLLACYLSYLV